jgi:N-acetylneuraminic acid mutarotase
MKKQIIQTVLVALCLGLFTSLSAQSWQTAGTIPSPRHHPVTFGLNGFGYMVTGTSSFGALTDDFYRYDPVADIWATLPDFPGGLRSYAIGTTYNGLGYVGFGVSSSQYFKDLWSFDPLTSQWTQLASCPGKARRHPSMMAADGKIYVGLGNDNSGDLKDFWMYDIQLNAWTQLPDIPANSRHHPFQFAIGNEVFSGMGHGGNVIYDDWYKWDTVGNTWMTLTDFPGEARVAGTQFSNQGFGYVLSGDGDNHNFMTTGEMWRYDAGNDSWTQLPSHPGRSLWAPGSFIIADTVYFMGGYNRQFSSFPNTMYKFHLNPLGIGQEEQALSALNFEIYPNPNSGQDLFWKCNTEVDLIEIIDAQGKLIRSTKTTGNSLTVSDLAAGFYQLRIYREGEMLAQKKLIRK